MSNTGRELVLEVGGIGYLVQVTRETSLRLSQGAQTSLQTSHIIREDAQQLFGFETVEERRLFDILRSVNGVGPKTALSILDENTPNQVAVAVANEDDGPFRAVSGIGPKTAKLIVVSLGGKLSTIAVGDTSSSMKQDLQADVTQALVGLGWASNAASTAVADVLKASGGNLDAAELLKLAISKLGAK